MSALAVMDADKAALMSVFGEGYDYTDHDEARAAIVELVDADREHDSALKHLEITKSGFRAEAFTTLHQLDQLGDAYRRFRAAELHRIAALARVKGGAA